MGNLVGGTQLHTVPVVQDPTLRAFLQDCYTALTNIQTQLNAVQANLNTINTQAKAHGWIGF